MQNKIVVLAVLVILVIIIVLLVSRSSSGTTTNTAKGACVGTFGDLGGLQEGLTEFAFGDARVQNPDFLFIGVGGTGAPCFRKLADLGYKVAALTTGVDHQEDDKVKYPFEVSPFMGDGEVQLNAFNAVFDPDVTFVEGFPIGNGTGWDGVGLLKATGPGGGGNHFFMDCVLPTPSDIDGPLHPSFKLPGDLVTQPFAVAGGPGWDFATLQGLSINEVESFQLPIYFGGTAAAPLPGQSESPSERGFGGPMKVIQFDGPPAGNQDIVLDSMTYAPTVMDPLLNVNPVPQVMDYNVQANSGGCCSQLQYYLFLNPADFRGERQTTAVAFLGRDAFDLTLDGDLKGKGALKAFVKTRSFVHRIVGVKRSNGLFKTMGVIAEIEGKMRFVRAKNVICAAGGEVTPRILETSGIGSSPILTKFGIPPMITLPAVGENLVNQYGFSPIYSSTDPAFAFNFYAQAFVGIGSAERVFQSIAAGFGLTPYGVVTGHFPFTDPSRYYASVSGFLLHPRSRGSVHISTPEVHEMPNWRPGYFTDGSDPLNPASGLSDPDSDMYRTCVLIDYCYHTILRMAALYPAANIQMESPPASVCSIVNRATRFAAYVPYVTAAVAQASHYTGSTIMNSNPALGVVDNNCKVHGSENLYIVDLGIVPSQPSGNPHGICMSIGLNAANRIAAIN
jgi:choline dehydrogenase-like flavoprotein